MRTKQTPPSGSTLATLSPDEPLDDLEPFASIVGDARIVGLGESAHLVHEFYLLRHRLLRFLVERMGFTAFVMESGWCEGNVVDAWLRGGAGEVSDIQRRGFTYFMGSNAEMATQLHWMREQRRSGSDLRFFGMDMVGAGTTPDPALAQVWPYLERVDPQAVTHFRGPITELAAKWASPVTRLYDSAATRVEAFRALPVAGQDRFAVLTTDLARLFDWNEPAYVAASTAEEFDFVRQHARLVGQLGELIRHYADGETGPSGSGSSLRDRFMADNLGWVLRQLDPDARIVVAAHNGHLQRQTFDVIYDGQLHRGTSQSLGMFLDRRYGAAYRPIAITQRTGTYGFADKVDLGEPVAGSVESTLGDPGRHVVLTDVRRGPSLPAVRSIRANEFYTACDLPTAFDATIVIDRSDMCDFGDLDLSK